MTPERATFGPRLRSARERAGLTLGAIAASTKIKASLLAELEQSDLSHWPHGLYRRAFFRAYVSAIGIASDPLVAEFHRLFPEEGPGISVSAPVAVAGEMRLTLAAAPQAPARPVLTSVAASLIDLCLVFALAGGVSWPTGVDLWMAVSAVALAYFSVATVFSRRTPGVRWLSGTRHAARRAPVSPVTGAREPLRIVPPSASVPRRQHSPETLAEEAPQTLHAVSG